MTMLIGINNQIIEATPEMEAEIKAEQAAYLANEKRLADERAARATAKAAAEGKLAALGLTTDDLRALGL